MTGLANPALVTHRLERALATAGDSVGIVYLDLDGFKAVNDSAGHAAGDRVLIDVGRRLARCMRPEDTVARMGGDEFVILCTGLEDAEQLHHIATRVLDSVNLSLELDRAVARIGVSAGVAFAADQDAGQLLRLAGEAMYRAKRAGKNRVIAAHADHEVEARSARAARLQPEIISALHHSQFEMYGQPVHSLLTGDIIAVETLLRRNHPSGEVWTPDAFADVVEGGPLMPEIGNFALFESCRIAASWTDTAADPPDVHMPMIANSLLSDLQALRSKGVRIATDDIGKGYRSLARITEFPVDMLKIDLTFTAGLGVEPAGDAVVRAVINIGQALRIAVVAEGVENDRQAALLRRYGCEAAQGYHFGRPLPEAPWPPCSARRPIRRGTRSASDGAIRCPGPWPIGAASSGTERTARTGRWPSRDGKIFPMPGRCPGETPVRSSAATHRKRFPPEDCWGGGARPPGVVPVTNRRP